MNKIIVFVTVAFLAVAFSPISRGADKAPIVEHSHHAKKVVHHHHHQHAKKPVKKHA